MPNDRFFTDAERTAINTAYGDECFYYDDDNESWRMPAKNEQTIIDAGVDVLPGKELRVRRALAYEVDPLITDFTILGFRKQSPSYVKGRKTEAEYLCAVNDDLVVKKTFTDVPDAGTGGMDLQVQFDWYDEDDTTSLTKTEVVKKLNKYEMETLFRHRRARAIDYLVAGAKGTAVETHIDAIFDHYYDEVVRYEIKGDSALEDAINAETDPTISAYLAIEIPDQNEVLKPISDIILDQIT